MKFIEWIKIALSGLWRAIQSRDAWRIRQFFYWLSKGVVFGEQRLLSKDEIILIDNLDDWGIVGHPDLSRSEKEKFIYGEELGDDNA